MCDNTSPSASCNTITGLCSARCCARVLPIFLSNLSLVEHLAYPIRSNRVSLSNIPQTEILGRGVLPITLNPVYGVYSSVVLSAGSLY